MSAALLSKYEEVEDKYEGRWFALTRDAKLVAIARAKVKPQKTDYLIPPRDKEDKYIKIVSDDI